MKQIAVYYNATQRHLFQGEMRSDVDLYRELLSPFLKDVEFILIDSANGEFPDDPTIYDGVILGGSYAFINDLEPWMKKLFEHIRLIDEAEIPCWGTGFGHQAIAYTFGGKISERTITLGAPHLEMMRPEPWMHPYMPTLQLYASNFQQVTEAPKCMRRLAIGRGNPNAMLAKGDHMIGLQFQPEITQWMIEAFTDECLSKHLIDFPTYQTAKHEIHESTDSKIVAKWMSKFFMQSWSIVKKPELELRIVNEF